MNSQLQRSFIKRFLKYRFNAVENALLLCTMSSIISSPVIALNDSESTQAKVARKMHSVSASKGTNIATEKNPVQMKELSLNDLHDLALLLRFVSGQCINVYQEAARRPVKATASPDVRPIKVIPVPGLPDEFLPARQEWLVFYLGTMEPVIRQMAKQVDDIRAGTKQVVIPPSLEASLRPLWEQWASNIQLLNQHLDELLAMFDDTPPDNIKIQNQAVILYDDVQRLEKVRKYIFLAIQSKDRTGNQEKVLISPP